MESLFRTLPLLVGSSLAFASIASGADEQPDAAGVAFFEKSVRPVLVEHCYKCHAQDSEKIKGGLVLDTREGIRRGGDNGPAVVPGDLENSLLIEAIRYHSKDFAMPPEKSGGKLPDGAIADLEKWVSMGAPDPRDGAAKVVRQQDTWAAAKDWWSWQPLSKPAVPEVKATTWPRGEIDRFILSGLEAKSLKPVGDADPLTLARRLYFDLTGLPPTPEQAREFVREYQSSAHNPAAVIEKLTDKLLASPQFGEHWGRHWLDVARYAESTGKEVNIAFPEAWRYRDYVIAAFNADKPFDEFIREQVAGDLLEARNDRERAEHLIATGFLAIGPKGVTERNPRQFALDVADEQIDAVSQAFMGMTVACARCHDHKFDPISQREYYAMAGIFLSTDTRYGTARSQQNRRGGELIDLPTGSDLPTLAKTLPLRERERKERRLEELREDQLEMIQERRRGGREDQNAQRRNQQRLRGLTEIGLLEAELSAFGSDGRPKARAMGAVDLPVRREVDREFPLGGRRGMRGRLQDRFAGARPPEFSSIGNAPLYARGESDKPGERVPRGFPAVLSYETAPPIGRESSGRLELAEWLASPRHPLTARVYVNRVWHWVFGRGLVDSPDNFGTTGSKPANPALLDYLANRFIENGWSVKRLVREIVLSRAYAMASTHDDANFAADPQNTLVWRMNERRLSAECLHDAMLAASGQLDLRAPIGSVIAEAGDGPIGGPRRGGLDELTIVNASATKSHRAVYLPVARDVLPEALSIFDFPEPSLVTGARESTNVPSQALYLLNSPAATRAAQKLSDRLMLSYPGGPNGGAAANLAERVTLAYWIVLSRPPSAVEQRAAYDFFSKFPGSWKLGDKRVIATRDPGAVNAAWTSFCRALFASAEFRLLN